MESNKMYIELLEWAQENSLDELLQNIEDVNSIKSLDLSNKNLYELPSFLFELSSLENLNLSHNNLSELPREIIKLKSLKTLDISWNHITHSLEFLSSNIKVKSAWNR